MHDGHFERHLRRSRARNAEGRAVLLESIDRHLGGRSRYRVPRAVFTFCYGSATRRCGEAPTWSHARSKRAVGVYPIGPFYARPPRRAGLLLGYTSLTEKEIAEGIRRLASVLASMNGRNN
jgi:GntR family transcriptional regulator/MocR family aminotransferase